MSRFLELKLKVEEWADEKGILSKATPLKQAEKTLEETQELIEVTKAQGLGLTEFKNKKGEFKNTQEELEHAIGDILVTIIIQSKMQDVDILDCLQGAYDIISKRKGKMIDGKFVKESDL